MKFPSRNIEISYRALNGHFDAHGDLGRVEWKATGMNGYQAPWQLLDAEGRLLSLERSCPAFPTKNEINLVPTVERNLMSFVTALITTLATLLTVLLNHSIASLMNPKKLFSSL
ncbi:hypothetical protein ACMFMF_011818 [Clarireedia jacksonii]